MRSANLAAWMILGLIAVGQPALAAEVNIVAQNGTEASRTRAVQDVSTAKQRLTDKIADRTLQAGRDKTPVSVAKPPSNAEPGLIF